MSALVWAIVIGVIFVLIAGIILLKVMLKRKKEKFEKFNTVPIEVLKQSNNLERRYEEELNQVKNGKRKDSPDPYRIIWEDAKRNRAGEPVSTVAEPSRSNASSDGNSGTNQLPTGGQSVQIQPPINTGENNKSIGEPKRNSNDNAGRRAALLARLRDRRNAK